MKTINMNTPRTLRNALMIMAILIMASTLLSVNNSAAAYMRMGVGARIIAMGEAGTTVTRDVCSGYWNPAGLTLLKDVEIATMYNFGLNLDRNHSHVALGSRLKFGAIAINWINAGTSNIDGYDAAGNPPALSAIETTASPSATPMNTSASILALRQVLPQHWLMRPKGFSLDVGAKFDLSQYLEAGAMVRDVYSTFEDEADKIPMEASVGIAAYPFIGVTFAADSSGNRMKSLIRSGS